MTSFHKLEHSDPRGSLGGDVLLSLCVLLGFSRCRCDAPSTDSMGRLRAGTGALCGAVSDGDDHADGGFAHDAPDMVEGAGLVEGASSVEGVSGPVRR